ncbi:hypothetical protein CsatA_010878 [Cannabis sativa]
MSQSSTRQPFQSFSCTKNSSNVSLVNLWHQRLGHPSKIIMNKVLHSLHIPTADPSFCNACQYGKLHQFTFLSSQHSTTTPFEIIHTDLWGPSPYPTNEGFKYYIIFIDDFTKYTWIFPLKVKSDTTHVFQYFNNYVERQFGVKIKSLQADWGGEFRPLKPILAQLGVIFRHPCPHTHQQQGRAERKHRHVTEIGLTLLAQANMPLKHWWDSFVSATYLINRLPVQRNKYISPFETLFHQKPDYSFLKNFGCACFPFLRPYNRHKFDFKTSMCVFLGYSPYHKGYRCLHPSGRIYIARSVTFDELTFPYMQLFPQPCPSPTPYPATTVTHIPHLTPDTTTPSSLPDTAPMATHTLTQFRSTESPPSPNRHITQHLNVTQPEPTPATNNPQPSTTTISTHPMQTRSKSGIHKPKLLAASITRSNTHSLVPKSVKKALADPKWHSAMTNEYYALQRNNTWVLVPYVDGMQVVQNKWLFRPKMNKDGTIERLKARLVAKGFQQTEGVDYFDTFSPVVKPSTIRIMFTLAVTNNWDIQQVDINNAFLNGDLKETVYMQQPKGFEDSEHPTHVCKLQKALYGLKQAPRAWYEKLKAALLSWGFINSVSDNSLFISNTNGNLLLLLVYVDDILITGHNPHAIQQVITNLDNKFALKTLGSVSYFLGFQAYRTNNKLYLNQSKYAQDILHKANMEDSKPCTTPMCPGNKLYTTQDDLFHDPKLYRSIIGSLQYLTLTRPDLSFAINRLSQYMQNPTNMHWNACKRVLRYIKGTTNLGLVFQPAPSLTIDAYSDADWACNLDDRKSTTGFSVLLGNNLISWGSKKQTAVARSSTESEYRALSTTATEVVWITAVLQEMGIITSHTPTIWCDNQGAQQLASNPVFHSRTKHIEVDVHYVRELINKHKVQISYIPTEEQPADLLTKALTLPKFNFLCHKLSLEYPPSSLRGDVEDTQD